MDRLIPFTLFSQTESFEHMKLLSSKLGCVISLLKQSSFSDNSFHVEFYLFYSTKSRAFAAKAIPKNVRLISPIQFFKVE